MKAIIYAGIALVSVAAVYGLADHYNSNKKGTINKLYTEEEVKPALVIIDEKNTTAVTPVEAEASKSETNSVSKNVKTAKKLKRSSKKINLKEFSRARIPEVEEEKIIPEVPVKIEEKKQ